MSGTSVDPITRTEPLTRKEAKLSENLEKRMKAYALAVGAAGTAAAMLAAPPAAEANIVQISSSVHYDIYDSHTGSINVASGLNIHDAAGALFASAKLLGTGGAQMRGTGGGALLGLGVAVNGGSFAQNFALGHAFTSQVFTLVAKVPGVSHRYGFSGSIAAGVQGYLGFKFAGGYYGWAKVTAHAFEHGNHPGPGPNAVFGTIGPIYEDTVKGQQILTGQTTAPESSLPFLVILAAGAAALPMWRGTKPVGSQQ